MFIRVCDLFVEQFQRRKQYVYDNGLGRIGGDTQNLKAQLYCTSLFGRCL